MPKAAKEGTTVHVIFTSEGIPGWFGPEPVAGSEPLDIGELRSLLPDGAPEGALATGWRDLLIRHCRVDGTWIPRPAAPATGPEGAAAEQDEADAAEDQIGS